MISGLPLSGQPGKAVGHAVGKLTFRHDLLLRPVTMYAWWMRRRCWSGEQVRSAEIEGRLSLAERGVGGLVVLVGEPGLGKTALAEHASVAARRRGFSVGWAACWQTAAVPPLESWSDLVRQLARPGVTSPDLAIAGGDRDSGRVEQAGRVVEWLRERADAPLLVVIDDLHWADAATLSVLTQVASVLASMPVVVVAAHRPVDAAGASPLSGSIAELQHHGLVLALRGLDVDGTTALVAAVRGSPFWGRRHSRCGRSLAVIRCSRGSWLGRYPCPF